MNKEWEADPEASPRRIQIPGGPCANDDGDTKDPEFSVFKTSWNVLAFFVAHTFLYCSTKFFFFFFFFFSFRLGLNSNTDFATFATGGHD